MSDISQAHAQAMYQFLRKLLPPETVADAREWRKQVHNGDYELTVVSYDVTAIGDVLDAIEAQTDSRDNVGNEDAE